jgi:putative SOS response-associated peptidase YedK
MTCAPIHNRMPVIMPKGARDRWLEPQSNVAELQSLLTPFSADQMEADAVSTLGELATEGRARVYRSSRRASVMLKREQAVLRPLR